MDLVYSTFARIVKANIILNIKMFPDNPSPEFWEVLDPEWLLFISVILFIIVLGLEFKP